MSVFLKTFVPVSAPLKYKDFSHPPTGIEPILSVAASINPVVTAFVSFAIVERSSCSFNSSYLLLDEEAIVAGIKTCGATIIPILVGKLDAPSNNI